MIEEILCERNLPPLKSKDEMIELLFKEEYGYLPPKPDRIECKTIESKIFCAGKAKLDKIEITNYFGEKKFTFPFSAVIPVEEKKHPFFVCINFTDNVPDAYMPTEEIIDNGFAVLSFCYQDITKDDNDFTNGLAGFLYEDGKREDVDAGKISMWAWAASRIMDYAMQDDRLDKNKGIVCGHSRLGKTALLAAATDERFFGAYSNNSGCSGAAISRGKKGETIKDICNVFPYWFCKNYSKYSEKEFEMPFDQHYLLAAIAPRYVYVASAAEDAWADPVSELLSCVAASCAYEQYNKKGFENVDVLPQEKAEFHDGSIGYHIRYGTHYLGREDWQKAIKFFQKVFVNIN